MWLGLAPPLHHASTRITRPSAAHHAAAFARAHPAVQEFSQWPTYPQLYVAGELLGGCDIVLEMAEAGELGQELAKAGAGGKDAQRQHLEGLVRQQPVMLFMKVCGCPAAWAGRVALLQCAGVPISAGVQGSASFGAAAG